MVVCLSLHILPTPVEGAPGAKGQPHRVIKGGSHFFHEDVVEEFNLALIEWLKQTDG